MTLSRANIDALCRLFGRLADGLLQPVEVVRLNELLAMDDHAQRMFADYALLDACLEMLATTDSELAAKRWTDAVFADGPSVDGLPPSSTTISCNVLKPPLPGFLPTSLSSSVSGFLGGTLGYFSEGMPLAYLIAAVLVSVAMFVGSLIPVSDSVKIAKSLPPPAPPVVPSKTESVGRITGMADCKWADDSILVFPSASVPLGQKYSLASGLMEITYDAGVKVILQGPATYEIDSRSGGFLAVGRLTARVQKKTESRTPKAPPPNREFAIPSPLFIVRTPTATVTDLGTEFGVRVREGGITETHVFVGKVKVTYAGLQDNDAREQIVPAGQAVRVNGAGTRLEALRLNDRLFVRTLTLQRPIATAESYADLVSSMKPQAYYRMERPDHPNDATLLDSAPGGHHGVLRWGDEYGGDPWRRGRFGSSLHFRGEGVRDYVDVPHFPPANTNELSVSAWVYAFGVTEWSGIVSEYNVHPGLPKTWQFDLGLNPDHVLRAMVVQRKGGYAAAVEKAAKPFPFGVWQHVAFVADGRTLRLYRNGNEVGSVVCDGVYASPSIERLTIGAKRYLGKSVPAPCDCWHGHIDELAIFDHALSMQEIRQLSCGANQLFRELDEETVERRKETEDHAGAKTP